MSHTIQGLRMRGAGAERQMKNQVNKKQGHNKECALEKTKCQREGGRPAAEGILTRP